jgi:Polyketide cyclase / dehydrase and lipid transport
MATIRKDIPLKVPAAQVWDVIRDVGAIHTRLAPGFVLNTRMEEGARVVTFANGHVARELIVTVDEETKRLVYCVVGGTATHHNASFQVIPTADNQASLVWITDVLPDNVVAPLSAMIDAGSTVIQRTLNETRGIK